MNILVLSNGHGEDVIGSKIIEDLKKIRSEDKVVTISLVGRGRPYEKIEKQEKKIKHIKANKKMPSRGFLFSNKKLIIADIKAGLIQETIKQIKLMLKLSKKSDLVICVGDLYPLILGYLTRKNYIYVNTKKSFNMATQSKQLRALIPKLRRTNWNFLELVIAQKSRCKAIFVRDNVTYETIRKFSKKTVAANPMMKGFYCPIHKPLKELDVPFILCLPGSRSPELEENFKKLLHTATNVEVNKQKGMVIFIPVTTNNARKKIIQILSNKDSGNIIISNDIEKDYRPGKLICICKKGSFRQWAGFCDVALATSGTATEQCVAMGIPVISIIGEGPQFNKNFALRQKNLLGEALLLTKTTTEATYELQRILANKEEANRLGNIGIKRMKCDGGSLEIAKYISEHLILNN